MDLTIYKSRNAERKLFRLAKHHFTATNQKIDSGIVIHMPENSWAIIFSRNDHVQKTILKKQIIFF